MRQVWRQNALIPYENTSKRGGGQEDFHSEKYIYRVVESAFVQQVLRGRKWTSNRISRKIKVLQYYFQVPQLFVVRYTSKLSFYYKLKACRFLSLTATMLVLAKLWTHQSLNRIRCVSRLAGPLAKWLSLIECYLFKSVSKYLYAILSYLICLKALGLVDIDRLPPRVPVLVTRVDGEKLAAL